MGSGEVKAGGGDHGAGGAVLRVPRCPTVCPRGRGPALDGVGEGARGATAGARAQGPLRRRDLVLSTGSPARPELACPGGAQ